MIRNGEETKEFFNKNKKEFKNYDIIQLVENKNGKRLGQKVKHCDFKGQDGEKFEGKGESSGYTILGSDDNKKIMYADLNKKFEDLNPLEQGCENFVELKIEETLIIKYLIKYKENLKE